MAHQQRSTVKSQELESRHGFGSEEVEVVLEVLSKLIPHVSIPVVQECLRAARSEIAYLTSTEGEFEDEADEDQSGPSSTGRKAAA